MVQTNAKLSAKKPHRVTKRQKFAAKKAAPKIRKSKKGSITEKLTRKQNSHIQGNTERLIASRVGHLELVKGSRREVEAKKADKKK